MGKTYSMCCLLNDVENCIKYVTTVLFFNYASQLTARILSLKSMYGKMQNGNPSIVDNVLFYESMYKHY